MPWAAAIAWNESRSAAEARIRMEQPRVVGGEGAAVMGAAAVITSKNYAAGSVPPVPWLLSMRFSSRRRSMTAFDRESDRAASVFPRKTLANTEAGSLGPGDRKTCPKHCRKPKVQRTRPKTQSVR